MTLVNNSTLDVEWYMWNGFFSSANLDWVAVTPVGGRATVVYGLDRPADFGIFASVPLTGCNGGEDFDFTSPGTYAVAVRHTGNPSQQMPVAQCGGQKWLEVLLDRP